MPSLTFKFRGLLYFSLLFSAAVLNAQQLAFPTAEGYGKFAVGGRGGKVYEVTTLKGTGAGSLGEAIAASGPRTVVFRVAGNIEGRYTINNPNITIAGQTAPGDGICIKGYVGISTDEVIIRYIRVRCDGGGDAINGAGNNIILDHVSASWSTDEVLSIYRGGNLTLQYCIIGEACSGSHRFGGLWGTSNTTCHHSLLVHNDSRNPRWKTGQNDYRNNVIYNWGYNTCYGSATNINMVANYYKPGPATKAEVKNRIAEPYGGNWYIADNIMVGDDEVTKDNWKGIAGGKAKKLDKPWDAMPIRQESAEEAFQTVLAHTGCSFPARDAVDKRIMEEVLTGTATYGNGIISSPSVVGGWPKLKSGEVPADTDHDGIPDAWEKKNGLNPDDAGDGSKTGKDGYTNLENYMNGLVAGKVVENKTATYFRSSFSRTYTYVSYTSSNLQLFVPQTAELNLEIFDMAGRRIILHSAVMEAGHHTISAGSLQLNPGYYYYRMSMPQFSVSEKFFLKQ